MEETTVSGILDTIVDNRTSEIDAKQIERIDAVVEMCVEKSIKPSNEDGTPNYVFVKLVGQNKAVVDDFGRAFWAAKKAKRLAAEGVTTIEEEENE